MYIVRNLQAIKWAEAMYANQNLYSIKTHIVTKSEMAEWLNALTERTFFSDSIYFWTQVQIPLPILFFQVQRTNINLGNYHWNIEYLQNKLCFVPNPKLASRRTVLMTSMR